MNNYFNQRTAIIAGKNGHHNSWVCEYTDSLDEKVFQKFNASISDGNGDSDIITYPYQQCNGIKSLNDCQHLKEAWQLGVGVDKYMRNGCKTFDSYAFSLNAKIMDIEPAGNFRCECKSRLRYSFNGKEYVLIGEPENNNTIAIVIGKSVTNKMVPAVIGVEFPSYNKSNISLDIFPQGIFMRQIIGEMKNCPEGLRPSFTVAIASATLYAFMAIAGNIYAEADRAIKAELAKPPSERNPLVTEFMETCIVQKRRIHELESLM